MSSNFTINGRTIGAGYPVYVIAEIGSNHDGSLERAKHLIWVAYNRGADAVKFQFYREDDLYPGVRTPGAIPDWWLLELRDEAARQGLDFFCSVFSLDTLASYVESDPVAIKIASPEATDTKLLRAAADTGLPVIVSTGACTFNEVLAVRNAVGTNLALLHCVSSYPARVDEMNLAAIGTMHEACRVPVGLSDHTTSTIIPQLAVAAGASIIEKHLTYSRSLPGPDHAFALEPREFADMVYGIRLAVDAMGDGVKRPTESEDVTDRRAA